MPTYEYVCRDCGEHLEVVQSFKDDALTVCPACEGSLKKVFGNIGIVFKGSGFYKTDSRSGSSSSTLAQTDKTETAVKADSGSTAKPEPAKSNSAKSESSTSDSKDSSGSTSKSTTAAAAAS